MIDLIADADAKEICDILDAAGFVSYPVGGCVRDAIMGFIPHDIDITTAAHPDKVAGIFSCLGYKVIKTGIKHGTVTLLYNGREFEITTMRSEQGYSDKRHPSEIRFVTDIEQDLKRRDFTVNSMAYSYKERKLIDPFGGQEDIDRGIIRCVGNASERFSEDALRIMRALRFASKLGFDIDDVTAFAMRECKQDLRDISSERIYNELCGVLCGKNAGKIIRENYLILAVVLPELSECCGFDQNNKHHCYDVLDHIRFVVDNIPPVHYLRLAALLHDIGKPQCYTVGKDGQGHFYGHAKKSYEIASRFLSEMKVDNDTKNKVLLLVKNHDTPLPKEEKELKKRISRLGADMFFDLLELERADCKAQDESVKYRLKMYDEIECIAKDIIERGECLKITDLMIDGNDIISLGVDEGKCIGEILRRLLSEVIDGVLDNNRDVLMKRAKEHLEKMF